MFSRTTIASSINKPIDKVSANRLITLMENPATAIANNVPISAIGKVKPVITVLRHEPRNRNTIRTVNAVPSSKVSRTVVSESRTSSALSFITRSITPAGNWALSSANAAFTAAEVATMLALLAALISKERAR